MTDIAPLLQQYVEPAVIMIVGAVFTVAATMVTNKLRNWLGADAANKASDLLNQGLTYALAYGQAQADAALKAGVNVDFKSSVLNNATAYANTHFPQLLADAGIDPVKLTQKFVSRISYNTTPPEQSVARPTPPPTAVVVAPPQQPLVAVDGTGISSHS